ncbi:MAG: hypothetical protein R3213_09855, partial [Flavobacteriaceae bacterium]|nr:hypothetical protein [Flavobacteriaceae bacterium]
MINTKIVSKTSELPPEWDEIAHPDILLSRKYLEGLQHSLPQNIQLYFLLISKEEALLGIALLQLVRVNLKEMLREPTGYRIERALTNFFSGLLKGHLLVVGNL